MAAKKRKSEGALATNRRARFNYDVERTFEAGMVLVGSEVKTLRGGKAALTDAYATVRDGEVFLYGLHIPEYPQAAHANHEPMRPRKLLLHGKEIHELWVATQQKGYTIVPLKLYFKDNVVKVELGLAKGRKRHDKRHVIAKREAERDMARGQARARRSD